MPPPPSQQGKFKPKKPKPKKKIKAGAATVAAAAEAAAAEPKATVSFAPSPYAGRGGRGRGRGGRGRGRMPMPTGKVYFTGGEKKKAPPSAASGSRSTRSSSGTRSTSASTEGGEIVAAASSPRSKKASPSTEEVVGQLEVAIGTSKDTPGPQSAGKDSILDSMDFEDQEGELFRPAGAAQGNLSLEGFMYDTDSSEEEESTRRKSVKESTILPLELPLNDTDTQSSETQKRKTRQAGDYPEPVPSHPASTETDGATPPSLFTLPEGDDWFLVQLPTRLPPLRKKVDENAKAMDVDDNEDEERKKVTTTEEPTSAYSEVVTHPVASGGFDNTLLSAAPGRIGKMIVYKSGKTVLVMEGADGSTLRLNVAEGLTCSFLQQPVAIDSEQNTYTELGEVGKSLVVSPILDRTYH